MRFSSSQDVADWITPRAAFSSGSAYPRAEARPTYPARHRPTPATLLDSLRESQIMSHFNTDGRMQNTLLTGGRKDLPGLRHARQRLRAGLPGLHE